MPSTYDAWAEGKILFEYQWKAVLFMDVALSQSQSLVWNDKCVSVNITTNQPVLPVWSIQYEKNHTIYANYIAVLLLEGIKLKSRVMVRGAVPLGEPQELKSSLYNPTTVLLSKGLSLKFIRTHNYIKNLYKNKEIN